MPLEVMGKSLEAMKVIEAMARTGLPSSASDAGVGALLAAAAVRGAHLNVRINAASLTDAAARRGYLQTAAALEQQARAQEAAILAAVEERLSGQEES